MPYKNNKDQKRAQAQWYQRNKEAIKERRSEARSEARKWVYNYKIRNSKCTDCKVSYPPHVLDFDHLANKSFGISRAIQQGMAIEKIKTEIKKCQIVCSNCHRERTRSRMLES
jgi:hypothetical protein